LNKQKIKDAKSASFFVAQKGGIPLPYVPVPKDLSKVKNKVAFNLTRRQLVCFGCAGLTGVPFYLLTKAAIGTDVAALCMIALMLPWFALGMYEKNGQPLEKIIYQIFRARFLWPRVRPYKTNNALMRQAALDKEVASIVEKNKPTGSASAKKAAADRRA